MNRAINRIQVQTLSLDHPDLLMMQQLMEAGFTPLAGVYLRDGDQEAHLLAPLGWTIDTGTRCHSIFDEQGRLRFIHVFASEDLDAFLIEVNTPYYVQEMIEAAGDHPIVTSGLPLDNCLGFFHLTWVILEIPELIPTLRRRAKRRRGPARNRPYVPPPPVGLYDFTVVRVA